MFRPTRLRDFFIAKQLTIKTISIYGAFWLVERRFSKHCLFVSLHCRKFNSQCLDSGAPLTSNVQVHITAGSGAPSTLDAHGHNKVDPDDRMGPGHHTHLNVFFEWSASWLGVLTGPLAPMGSWGKEFEGQSWDEELRHQKYEALKLTNQRIRQMEALRKKAQKNLKFYNKFPKRMHNYAINTNYKSYLNITSWSPPPPALTAPAVRQTYSNFQYYQTLGEKYVCGFKKNAKERRSPGYADVFYKAVGWDGSYVHHCSTSVTVSVLRKENDEKRWCNTPVKHQA